MGAPENMARGARRGVRAESCEARAKRYHIYHPYQVAMNSGKLTREQIQGWVCNRFYYQISIPIKDAAILSNMPDRDHRRNGSSASSTTTARKATRVGSRPGCAWARPWALEREEVTSLEHVLPGVRFAVDAYVNFAAGRHGRKRCARASPSCSRRRSTRSACPTGRSTIPGSNQSGYAYFRKRLSEARRDVEHGLRVTLDYFKTRAAAGARSGHSAVQARHSVVHAGCDADRLRNRSRARRCRDPDAR